MFLNLLKYNRILFKSRQYVAVCKYTTGGGGNVGSYEFEYKQSIENPDLYWQRRADEIEWFKKPTKIVDKSNSPFEKWFLNGQLNAAYNCLDVHVKNGFGSQAALIHDSPVTNTIKTLTYEELLNEVALFAGVLSKYGVTKNDRVLIYMPMIPQAVVAMLASVRLGAIHSLVFGGFASKELSTRVNHAKPKIIISANVGVEPGRLIDYKDLLDKAIDMSEHKPQKVIFYNRTMFPPIDPGSRSDYYLDYTNEISKAKPHDCVPVDSDHPLYLLYTSGTTGAPKGVVRPTAGYIAALKYSMSAFYGVQPGEAWWAASDLGWTVGHSYACYGPLAARNTAVLYEGKPIGTPDAGAYFRVISQHKVVSMFVAPTAVRAIHQNDPKAKLAHQYPLNHLRYMFVAGEHCDHETMHWLRTVINKPAFDHWWQTETGWPITSTCVGLLDQETYTKVPIGVSGKPVPGYDIKVINDKQKETKPKEIGRIVIKMPLPPGTISTLWENDDLFKNLYFKKFQGYYDTMDVGYKTEDGYITVLSRADDVINVAGHRISAAAIEEAILEHEECADCAVVSLRDRIKGDVPYGFVCITQDSKTSEKDLIEAIVQNVRQFIGPVAAFKQCVIVKKLPKTRSGKIARNCLKAMINNESFKIPVTIEDANVFKDIKQILLNNGFQKISDPDN